jgi:putative addiction module component (TIGR02574 family)
MAASLSQIEADALQLPPEDRVRLADHLLASVAGESDVDDAWAEEIERRLAEAESGTPFVPVDDAVARARRAIS